MNVDVHALPFIFVIFLQKNIKMVKSWKMRWARYVELLEVIRNPYAILFAKLGERERKPLERHRRRWKYDIKLISNQCGGRV
jgi:hypothetical protein